MKGSKLYFAVSGGSIFYFFAEDIIEKKDNEIKLKKTYHLVHQMMPMMTPQGPAANIMTLTFRFDNVILKFEAFGEVPDDSAVFKAVKENQTGLRLV